MTTANNLRTLLFRDKNKKIQYTFESDNLFFRVHYFLATKIKRNEINTNNCAIFLGISTYVASSVKIFNYLASNNKNFFFQTEFCDYTVYAEGKILEIVSKATVAYRLILPFIQLHHMSCK